jgi:hypothetical protein
MGQVTHVTGHAAILGHGLLGGPVAGIDGMWANKGEYAGEDGSRQPPGHIVARSGRGRVVGVEMAIVGGDGGSSAALGATTEALEEFHGGEMGIERFRKGRATGEKRTEEERGERRREQRRERERERPGNRRFFELIDRAKFGSPPWCCQAFHMWLPCCLDDDKRFRCWCPGA